MVTNIWKAVFNHKCQIIEIEVMISEILRQISETEFRLGESETEYDASEIAPYLRFNSRSLKLNFR